MMQLKIEKSKFKEYSLDKISEALQSGLSNNYKEVEVSIVDCPNLRDWACPSEGISGNQKIIDVGGEPYMHDPNLIGAEFDYEEISKMIGSEKSYALGAGSGAMSCLEGHCGELVINENLITDESKSIIARVGSNKECIAEKYTARKHGGLGNVFYTDGVRGKVIKIKIKGRSGEQGSLPQAMRKALSDNLKIEGNDHLALAGVFRILKGKIKSHVQPDYKDIKHEYYDPKQMKCVKDFLQFYEPVGPELQGYSILWTGDPTGGDLNLRESGEHTHFHSYTKENIAGHYHFDVTPEEIEYEGYFNTAEEVHRVNNIYKELNNKK
ncbi:DUF1907 domain-containing protein [Candidatus Pelagibacter sp.]|jgi:hypothetical protein|nr:DUF1907 domain-containing protein [Candidatus Pelagibacter sp.]MDB3970138.1 DUF1907 domain-containing protein [Candidatus Pelagibacter sp.]MDB4351637.1 DUF1907 domain-containing protein [Candidatus Pelagibacter sp.]MDB4812104.1 DUF1907 domain-containing protein [Candidatus Pelagibacter sp.]MDC0465597.1 DUF1907 domain-containing protein [Candidatus Pelagibacter sp.]